MFWNHRVMKRKDLGNSQDVEYGIVEAYFDEGTGEVIGWTEGFIEPVGTTFHELKMTLQWMVASLEKGVLDEARLIGLMDEKRDLVSTLSGDRSLD